LKVAVAMSGGVDSTVAAAMLKKEGYQVIGITMQICPLMSRASDKADDSTIDTEKDAEEAASRLGIPHYVMDLRDVFARKVIANFCEEYRQGRTPNPCIRCNRYIKFDALLEKAKGLGADFIATGHYARIEKDSSGNKYLLKKGADKQKDQSYMLYALTGEQLKHTLLPVGNLTKEHVRQIAEEIRLPAVDRPESQDICFIPDNDYAGFFENYLPGAAKPGPILDEAGNVLGNHRGIIFYTIGQRRGLNIAAAEPLYVIAIKPEENAIIAGTREKAFSDELIASGLNWIGITGLTQPITVKAKIRYHHHAAEAIITPAGGNKVHVRFTNPQMAITPGQAVVFYNGDTVVGGGTIESSKNTGDIAENGGKA